MPELYQSLSHSRWHCKYHIVFVPKKRRSVLYGRIRQALGPIFHALARQKECRIVEGHICKDHVHMCIEIPPKYAVASTIEKGDLVLTLGAGDVSSLNDLLRHQC